MAVNKLYTLYAATINGTLIDQISSFEFNPGLEQFIMNADGAVDPTFSAVKTLIPKVSLTTKAIAAGLAFAGMNGANITSGASFFYQQMAQGGTRLTGSNHLKMAATKGMIFPRSLRAGHNESAELSYEIILLTDGGGAPVAITTGEALTGTPVADQYFVAGPVKLNGTTVNGIQSINIDFGIQEIIEGGDGEVYPSFAGIMSRKPKITIEARDMDIMETLGIGGAPQGTTDSVIYLRKVQAGGTRVADATAEHIAIKIDAGHLGLGPSSANSDDPSSVTLELTPIFDGTNAILAIDPAAAIV